MINASKEESHMAGALGELVLGIDHVAIAVEDLDEAIRWYSSGLGLGFVERRTTSGAWTAMTSAVMSLGPVCVVLICGTSSESQVSRFIEHFGPGVQHLAFRVSDLDLAIDRVVSAGGKPDTPVVTDEGIRQVFLRRDPGSGVRIELIERNGGTFTDESVERLFRAFESHELF